MRQPDEIADPIWFAQHRTRVTRIRRPHEREADAEFATLGTHDRSRRRMLILRVPDGPHRGALMPIPFLQAFDEEIANEDAVLLPIIHDLMAEARGALQ